YPLQQTLTASAGGAPGAFTWTIASGLTSALFAAPGLPFGLPFAVGPTATLQSIAPSGAPNDVQITVSFIGAGARGSATQNFTVQAPQSMTPTGNVHSAVPRGYRSLIGYSIQDQFGATLPRNVEVNELWIDKPAINDFAGTNWGSLRAEG